MYALLNNFELDCDILIRGSIIMLTAEIDTVLLYSSHLVLELISDIFSITFTVYEFSAIK